MPSKYIKRAFSESSDSEATIEGCIVIFLGVTQQVDQRWCWLMTRWGKMCAQPGCATPRYASNLQSTRNESHLWERSFTPLMDPLTTAIIGLAGGAIALTGQVLIQRLIHGFNRAKERDALLREKGEAIVLSLIEHMDWARKEMWWEPERPGDDDSLGMNKARALQRLYFPTADDVFVEMEAVLHRIEKTNAKRIESWANAQVADVRYDGTPHVPAQLELMKQHSDAWNRCLDEIGLLTRQALRH